MSEAFPEEFRSHLSPEKDWKEIVAWVGDLPPLPHVAAKALVMVDDPSTTAGKLSELLGGDPALAARVLKIANSAMFSRQREITTINQAVMTVGFKTLKGIIVAATLRQLNRHFGKIEQLIWKNSACTAVGARHIAAQLRKPFVDEAFLLGLLHDLGKLILMRQIPDDYKRVAEKTKSGTLFVDAEQELFGFAHPLIGALVAKKWNFSLEACQVILHHHDPLPATLESEQDEKTAIVMAANFAAHQLGNGHFEGYPELAAPLEEALLKLGFEQDAIEPVIADISEAFTQQGAVFM